jgi:hypothetical protein
MLSFEILDIKKSMEPKLIRCNPVGPESYLHFFPFKIKEGKKFQKAISILISKVLISSSNK